METIRGCISEILNFSLNDGPGIRTTIFLKGCLLNCLWCHNPEAQRAEPANMYSQDKCIHCGMCSRVCEDKLRNEDGSWAIDNIRCSACGKCIEVCRAGANKINGCYMTAEDVLCITKKDMVFYKESGGGVTISGGEPLMQSEFLLELARLHIAEDISTALETCGYAPWNDVERVLPYIRLFLYDWKVTDSELHRRVTGVDNLLIRENLYKLNNAGARIILRCPIIPGINDTQKHFCGIGELTEKLRCIEQVNVLPYHAMGNDKRKRMGNAKDGFHTADEETKHRWQEMLQGVCNVPVCI